MKPLWQSRTFWLNLLAGVAAIANGQPANAVVPPDLLAMVVASLNIGLRLLTSTPAKLG